VRWLYTTFFVVYDHAIFSFLSFSTLIKTLLLFPLPIFYPSCNIGPKESTGRARGRVILNSLLKVKAIIECIYSHSRGINLVFISLLLVLLLGPERKWSIPAQNEARRNPGGGS